jgi:ABC-type glycerol-3-phosphate transport system substrate-binding protein
LPATVRRDSAIVYIAVVSLARLAAWILCVGAGCGDTSRPPPAPIRFLHTFSAQETELFNATMVERGLAVEPSLVPFARGQQVISEILRAGKDCPDAIRIDATWLPELVDGHLLAAPPADLSTLDWSPEAAELARYRNAWWGVPQTLDGLVVVRDAEAPAPHSPAIADLLDTARAARSQRVRYPLGVRVDGYWLVPWLRAEGADFAPRAIDGDGAPHALAAFAAVFGDLAARPPPAGSEAPEELRRWNDGELAYWVAGPWQLGGLHDRERLAVTPLARAPRGGQLLVVPACAQRAEAGWRLARELTSITDELVFADAFATVPTRRAALEQAPPLARAQYEALRTAEMLPRSPFTPLLFDDLNPALAAVVDRDATADEAIEGVRRGWRRLENHR